MMKITGIPSTRFAALLPFLALSSPAPTRNSLSKRAVSVLTPRWGHRVQYPGNHTQITWTEPTTRDIRVTLVRGAPGQLVEVGPYDSYVDNDGQYEWLNEDYEDTDLKSGCDYKFKLSLEENEDDFGESEYFVIVRDGDGGLTPETTCPGPRRSEGETVKYADLAKRAAANGANQEDVGTEPGSAAAGAQSKNGVSRTTLIIAVVVSDIGMLLLLAAAVLFGRRRSWFASRDFLANYVGVVQRARAKLEEQSQGQMYLKPGGNASTKEKSYVDAMSDGTQPSGGYGSGGGSGYAAKNDDGARDVKIAQLE